MAKDLPVAAGPGRVVAGLLGVVGEPPVGIGRSNGLGMAMDALIPSRSSAAMMLSWNEATDWPCSGNDSASPAREWMRSWWSTKSKSMAKTGLPSACPMRRVVIPRPVRWNGTFHQWLRRMLAARRICPRPGRTGAASLWCPARSPAAWGEQLHAAPVSVTRPLQAWDVQDERPIEDRNWTGDPPTRTRRSGARRPASCSRRPSTPDRAYAAWTSSTPSASTPI